MFEENNKIFSAAVLETSMLKVIIGKGISKDDAVMFLGKIIIDIGQEQTNWGDKSISYCVVAETEGTRYLEDDDEIARYNQFANKHLN